MNKFVEETLTESCTKSVEDLIAELYQTEGKAEIIDGRVVEFMSTGDEPSTAAGNIFFSLKNYQRQSSLGKAYTDNAGYIVNLPDRKSLNPDVSFHTGGRTGMKFLQGAPIFAVEVRSENDYGKKAEKQIAEKRRNYFAAGTEVVWDVDLQNENIIKSFHRDNPNEPRIFKLGDTADAEPALPHWRIAVDELFE